MGSSSQDAVDLSVVNFSSALAADALSQDVNALGYLHRVESGPAWLRRKPARRRPNAHIVLVGGDNPVRGGTSALVDRLARTPWVCVLDRRDAVMAEGLMRAATEFLQSPWSREELAVRLERFTTRLQTRQLALRTDFAGLEIVGAAPAFCRSLTVARRVAACAAPVLIEGETGTGKELIAQLVHRLSDRAGRAFVPVNCGCLPTELVENELFGHEAGAYTGATTARAGLVQQAEGGTLFLDEVDTLPPRAQVALLRFLQRGEVRPMGGGRMSEVDVRVLSAANRPLAELVAAGTFREDLFFRLNVLELSLPPLRERRADIPVLARHFMNRYGAAYGLGGLALSDAARAWIMAHDWPGNVRQLDNLIHRAVLSAEGPLIELGDIAPPGTEPVADSGSDSGSIEPFASAKVRAIDAFERRYLTTLMHEAGGNVTAAAAQAGKERGALGRLLKKHGLERERFR